MADAVNNLVCIAAILQHANKGLVEITTSERTCWYEKWSERNEASWVGRYSRFTDMQYAGRWDGRGL